MRPRERIAQYLVASVLVFAPFALGGAPRWAICIAGLIGAAAAVMFFTSRRELETTPPLLAFIGLAAAFTFLQAVPLPAGLVELISPGKYRLVLENARALGEKEPSFMPLSMEPAATRLELAKLLGYLGFAYAAMRLAANPARRQWLLSVVAAVGGAMALTALLHLAFDADKLYGLYQPRQALRKPTLAPLLNHNHLSALMALTSPIAVGLAIASSARQRIAWVGVAALCASVGLLAESRGGALALFVGLATVGALAAVQRHGPRSPSRMTLPDKIAIGVAGMSSLVLLAILTAGGVLRDLTGTRLSEVSDSGSRFGAWRSSSQLLQEFPWTGIGRGSFEMASTRVHDSRSVVYPHLENEYLQAVIDWGVLGAAALALVLVWVAINAARSSRHGMLEAGAFAGGVALACENLTDFSLWMPGVALPAIATMAVLVAVPVSVVSSSKVAARRGRLGAGLAAIVLAIIVAGSPLGRGARDETRSLAAAQGKGSPASEVARAKAVFERHPSDYVSAGLLAQALFRARDRRAIAVVNRGLDLHPTSGDLYKLAGRMLLASQRRDQARTAYASALKFSARRETLDEILDAFPSDADAVRALPLVPAMIREWTDQLRQRGRVPLALAYLERYLSLYPDDSGIQLHAAAAALDGNNIEMAMRRAERAFALDPSLAATTTLSRALIRGGQPERARSVLEDRLKLAHMKPADRVELALVLADVLVTQGANDASRRILHDVLNLAEGRQLAQVHRKLAEIEEKLGNRHQAAWERERAAEVDR